MQVRSALLAAQNTQRNPLQPKIISVQSFQDFGDLKHQASDVVLPSTDIMADCQGRV